jgi:hypothetical protein
MIGEYQQSLENPNPNAVNRVWPEVVTDARKRRFLELSTSCRGRARGSRPVS